MASVRQGCFNFCKEFKAYVSILTFFSIIFSQSDRFALRGNVLDLAIGIIIGTAFTNVVQSLVNDIITPPFGLLLGGVDFVNLTIKMKNFVYKDQPPVVIRYGKFMQAILSLLIVAFALFFIIKAINQLHKMTLRNKEKLQSNSAIEVTEEVKVLREIRDLLTRQSPTSFSPNQLL
jgi:large conductance mechanosensitive channel